MDAELGETDLVSQRELGMGTVVLPGERIDAASVSLPRSDAEFGHDA